jgi:hypothetical protein
MPRFSVDYLDVLLDLLRGELDPSVKVMTRIPDHIDQHLPIVVIRRVGGDSRYPEFYDVPWINVQCWTAPPADPDTEPDALRTASDLADDVRRIFWTAYRTQQIVAGKGWIGSMRESTAPQEIGDIDRPLLGRYTATYEMRVRPVAA